MKYDIKEFGKSLRTSSRLIGALPVWKQFEWGVEVGHYVILGETSDFIMDNWSDHKDELRQAIILIKECIENGEDETKGLICTDFFPGLIACPDLEDQKEILNLLGTEGQKLLLEMQKFYTRNEEDL